MIRIVNLFVKLLSAPPTLGMDVSIVGYGQTIKDDPESNSELRRYVGHNHIKEISHAETHFITLESLSENPSEALGLLGDSGGPLFNSAGEIVGVFNSLSRRIQTNTDGNQTEIAGNFFVNLDSEKIRTWIASVFAQTRRSFRYYDESIFRAVEAP